MDVQTKLVYLSLLAQLLLPICVLLLNGKRKVAERKAGTMSKEAAVDNKAWSLPVVLTSNSLDNQFQLPVLFYVLCLVLIQIGQVSLLVVLLAWWFVLSRWAHAYVHVTSNYIPARMTAFFAGAISLLVLFLYTCYLIVTL